MLCRFVWQHCKKKIMCAMRQMRNGSLNIELPITGAFDCMLHSVVLYLRTRNETTREIYQKVGGTFSNGIIKEQQVGNW